MTITDTIVPTIPTAKGPRTMGTVAITDHDPILATLEGCGFLADTAREFGWVDADWAGTRQVFIYHRASDTVSAHDVTSDHDRDVYVAAEALAATTDRVNRLRADLADFPDGDTYHHLSGLLDGALEDQEQAWAEVKRLSAIR